MRLLVLDVEGTLFRTAIQLPGTTTSSTIWQGIAHALGADAVREEVETHRKWEAGKYRTYVDWMKDTIAIHQRYGLSRSLFRKLIGSALYNDGVKETLLGLDRTRYEPMLITGGFRELAARAQRALHIHHAFAACEYLFGTDGKIISYNLLPCDYQGKIDFIRLMLQEYGLPKDAWVFVGDGANDVPIASEAPVAIGYQCHPDLRKAVKHVIEDFRQLADLL